MNEADWISCIHVPFDTATEGWTGGFPWKAYFYGRLLIMEALLVLSQLVVFILCSENLFYKAESFLRGVGGRVTSLVPRTSSELYFGMGPTLAGSTALCMCCCGVAALLAKLWDMLHSHISTGLRAGVSLSSSSAKRKEKI